MKENEQRCIIREVSKLLGEEPRLEAVALRESDGKLSFATLGRDHGGRLAGRVSEAVASGSSECGHLNAEGLCSACGADPRARAQDSRVVVKEVLGSTLIEKQTCTTAISFWRWISVAWPKYAPREHRPFEQDEEEWRTMAWLSGGCLLFGLLGLAADWIFNNHAVAVLLYMAAYVCGAWDAAKDAWETICDRRLDVHFLMLAVAGGAASIGAWREGALLLFLFSASGAMEHYAMGRTKREISALFRGAPKTARVLEDGRERQIEVEALERGMVVLVTAGEQIPADLEIIKGETSCDESNLTGEALPVSKEPGDTAMAGTMNLWGAVEGRVLRPASESSLQKIIRLIHEAQGMKAPSQKFTDKFGTAYTWAILSLCTAMFFVWWLALSLPPFVAPHGVHSAFYRAMTLLVVASPCALVLSVPSSILSAIACGARRGVLFRGGAAIETLADVRVVALDKTGTLTTGDLTLEQIDCLRGDEARLHAVAWSLARLSEHPLSRAIRKSGHAWNARIMAAVNFETAHGKGVSALLAGKRYFMGSREFIATRAPGGLMTDSGLNASAAEVWVAGPDVLGRMTFRDEVREQLRETMDAMRRMKLRSVMLTGDRLEAAEKIGLAAGVDEVRAGLLPEEKVAAIQGLKSDGKVRVAMIGDGVNDAPCIAAADVGVAMGARGSDAALEQAEVVLMNDRLENFLLAYSLSCRSRTIIRQNITVALGTVIFMMLAAFLFPIPLAFGVAAHEGSTLLVVLNSLRLLALKQGK